ncbi:hypothetical protein FLK61_35910 [Paenalkalicoccus suaedae]|uniref:Uncharacterized protein n=1 Tax=Paenalkalicoccus suaedae TaxID=2592382 RepID=A0A859FGX7_9BACI|nr:hypothetical protein [Paenalkalicoccus suaedae]QKS72050.1 hypothetical protein FLK61_35910 [Paenalkalicoccus suaedae]
MMRMLFLLVATTIGLYPFSSIDITLMMEDKQVEWEYQNPNKIEFEEGSSIYRDERAVKSFEEIMESLPDGAYTSASLEAVRELYPSMTSILVKKVTKDKEEFIWSWQKDEE